MRCVFNSAVIGRPGHYEYRLLTELEGEAWLKEGRFVSRVGNLETQSLSRIDLESSAPQSREPISMVAGDEGLVVRLVLSLAKKPFGLNAFEISDKKLTPVHGELPNWLKCGGSPRTNN
jgi:hypothetical protein